MAEMQYTEYCQGGDCLCSGDEGFEILFDLRMLGEREDVALTDLRLAQRHAAGILASLR